MPVSKIGRKWFDVAHRKRGPHRVGEGGGFEAMWHSMPDERNRHPSGTDLGVETSGRS
ncbi:MAG: hypothetical protein JWO93_556 [Micrococcaceae bacterium]|jgi:hypothetical protein|nr:hypothetical protein [Micrococcaceae bacterium]